MTRIQILGSGCQKCEKLYENAVLAAKELGIEYQIEKVTDMAAIVGCGVMTTPAMVVNGEIRVSGRVPSTSQLKEMLA